LGVGFVGVCVLVCWCGVGGLFGCLWGLVDVVFGES
jgi:hypothetical protein